MKNVLATTFLLYSFLTGKTQTHLADTSKVEQYCEVNCTTRTFNSKVNVEVDFGEFLAYTGKDKRVTDMEGDLKKFNRVTDALNYVGSLGWTLQNSYITTGDHIIYHFIFKKTFLKSEIVEKPSE